MATGYTLWRLNPSQILKNRKERPQGSYGISVVFCFYALLGCLADTQKESRRLFHTGRESFDLRISPKNYQSKRTICLFSCRIEQNKNKMRTFAGTYKKCLRLVDSLDQIVFDRHRERNSLIVGCPLWLDTGLWRSLQVDTEAAHFFNQ